MLQNIKKYICIILVLISCNTEFPVKGVKLTTKIYDSESSIEAFWYKDIVLYKIPQINSSTETTLDTAGNVINQDFIIEDTTYQYFVYRGIDSIGFLYKLDVRQRVPVASFLKERTITSFADIYNKTEQDSLIRIYPGNEVRFEIKKLNNSKERKEILLYLKLKGWI